MLRRLLLACLSLLAWSLSPAQEFTNPSFEGPIRLHFPPPDWSPCHPNSTPDTGPGTWGQALSASDGQSFVVLVIRDYASTEQNVEEVSQVIAPALQAGARYYFSVDLGYLPDLAHLPGQTSLAAPCRLQVWGGTSLCQPGKLLWQSPVINHANWQPYVVSFTADTAISVLRFVSAHAVAAAPSRGNVCLDNLSPVFLGDPPRTGQRRDTTLCAGDSLWATFDADQVRWPDGDTARSRWVSQAGTYVVELGYTVRYALPGAPGDPIWIENTVTVSDTLQVTLRPRPSVELGRDTLLCLGSTLELDGGPPGDGLSYRWSDGFTGPQREVDAPGHYRLLVDQDGCTAAGSIVVAYRDCRGWLTFPNVFSPNGDGINERFEPIFAAQVQTVALYLYDRWGREVYATDHLYPGWDGFYQGRPAPAGVYLWAVRWTDPHGAPHQARGSLTLLR